MTSLCTKCGKNPKAKSHLWCKTCKNAAEKDRYWTWKRDAERRGFLAGARAMQQAAVSALEKLADAQMNGQAAANLVRLRVKLALPQALERPGDSA